MLKRTLPAAGIAAVLSIGSAYAAGNAVQYDPRNDTGFVPRIAVQIALNWTNQKYQENARTLSFYNEEHQIFSAVCQWSMGQATRTVDYKAYALLNSTADATPSGAIVKGHFLTGIKQPPQFIEVGFVPRLGVPCVGDDGSTGAFTEAVEIFVEQSLVVTDQFVVLWKSSQ